MSLFDVFRVRQYLEDILGCEIDLGTRAALDTYPQLAGAAPAPDLLPALNQDELLALLIVGRKLLVFSG